MQPPPDQPARRTARRRGPQPVVTYSLIGACVIVYGAQWLTGQELTTAWAYWPPLTAAEPWRMLTSAFLHSADSIAHLLLNMLTLYLFGPPLESLLGRVRFLVLYLVAAFAGSVAVLLISPNAIVLGASGAIFGVMGGYFVVLRRLGRNSVQLLVVIALNLAIGFFIPQVAWQAHLGGLLGGVAVAGVYVLTRRREQRRAQVLGVAGIVVILLLLTVLGATLLPR
jgi:membrane associated rhomboid family serine protease